MELAEGTFLQGRKYKIEKVLGQGTYGITYLASVCSDATPGAACSGTKVAVKEFFMHDINSRKGNNVTAGRNDATFQHYKEKFRRESASLSRLSHPNIVKVLEEFEENNTAYYVMEYIDGGNLNQYLEERGGRLGEEEVIEIADKIACALTFMHEGRMLHLDLKPGNVMRTVNGDIKLIDFGLSKQYLDNGQPETSTKVGQGTPGYAAPEQAGYRRDNSFAATMDVYSLGATLYKLLTGKTPPNAYSVLEDGFPRAELTGIGVSEQMTDLIEHAMSPKRLNRPQSVADLMDSLPGGDTIVASVVDDDNTYEPDPALCFAGPDDDRLLLDRRPAFDVRVSSDTPASTPAPRRLTFSSAMGNALSGLLSFSGRATRMEYAAALVLCIIFGIIGVAGYFVIGEVFYSLYAVWTYSLLFLITMLTLPLIAVSVRRSRDICGSALGVLPVLVAVAFAGAAAANLLSGGMYWDASAFTIPVIISVAAVIALATLPSDLKEPKFT